MFFYIFMAFMFVMILGFLTGLSLVLIKRVDMELPKKQRILIRSKRAGLFVVVYMGVFYLAYASMKGYYLKECGPNQKDVEVMTPQAEVITNYILKNGISESLADIPDLPYKLEKCEREILFQKYRKKGYINEYFEEMDKEDAKGEVLKEKCEFSHEKRTYDVDIRFSAVYTDVYMKKGDVNASKNILNSEILKKGGGELTFYNKKTETGMSYRYEFEQKSKKWIYYNNPFMDDEKENKISNPQIYSTKDDGICNPMRM